MTRQKKNNSPYRASSVDRYTVPDSRISITEASLRNELSHLYETAVQSVKIPLFSWVDLIAGAGASALITTIIKYFSTPTSIHRSEWIIPIVVIGIYIFLIIRKLIIRGDIRSQCLARDNAINAVISGLKKSVSSKKPTLMSENGQQR